MVFQNRRNKSAVRFSATVQVREYALTVGDVSLCIATPRCPRICRSHPLPLTLTDTIVRIYHEKLRENPSSRLKLQTCESQMKRLLEYPGSKEDRMKILTHLNIELYMQRLRECSTPPSMWDEHVLQMRLGFDNAPVRVAIVDDDDREAHRIARPTGDPIIQEAIVKAVVAATKNPSKLYAQLLNSQSGSKHVARKKAVTLEKELYGRSGLSVGTNALNARTRCPKDKKRQRHKAGIKPGLENILPRFLPKTVTWV